LHAQLVFPQPGRGNRKTGDIPTAYVARKSCPLDCPLLGRGCYAETGNVGLHWRRMRGVSWATFCRTVAEKLGPRQLWRYAVAGDLPGFSGLIDRAALQELTEANQSRPVIAYTHKPVLDGEQSGGRGQSALYRRGDRRRLPRQPVGQRPGPCRRPCRSRSGTGRHDPAARLCAPAPIARPREAGMGRDNRRIPRPPRRPADPHPGRAAHRGLPGDLHGHDLRGVPRLRQAARGHHRLPGAWRLARRRGGNRRPRRVPGRAVELPRPPDDGSGHRRRASRLTPAPL
jgi:hypothetical protein